MGWDVEEETTEEVNHRAEVSNLLDNDGINTIEKISNNTDELARIYLNNSDITEDLNKHIDSTDLSKTIREVDKKATVKQQHPEQDEFLSKLLNNDGLDFSFSPTVDAERKKRYKVYTQIIELNYISQRILKAYSDNILIKNAQSKKFLNIGIREDKKLILNHMNRISDKFKDIAENISQHFGLHKRLKRDIDEALRDGDVFIELFDLGILDELNKEVSILTENTISYASNEFSAIQKTKSFDILSNTDTILVETTFHTKDGSQTKVQKKKIPILFETNYSRQFSEHDKLLYESEINSIKNKRKQREIKINNQQILNESTLTDTEFDTNAQIINESEKILDELSGVNLHKLDKRYLNLNESELEKLDTLTENLKKLDEAYSKDNTTSLKPIREDSSDNIWGFDLNQMFKTKEDNEEVFKISDIGKIETDCLDDIILHKHQPENVIIVEQGGIAYGYLIIDEIDSQTSTNYIDSFRKFTNGLLQQNVNEKSQTKAFMEEITKQTLDKVRTSIEYDKIRQGEYNGKKFFDNFSSNKEISKSLKIIIWNKLKSKTPFKFRFVSPDKIVHFAPDKGKYFPYGTSVIDPLVSPVKLYTLSIMATVVSRLSRASVIRKWTVDTGTEQRNGNEIIENLKNSIKNKSTNYNNLSNLENISNIITDYKDMATLTVNGKSTVDMEIMPMQDRGVNNQDSEEQKMDIVAAGGVPSIYLNIVDNADLREALVNLNISFANNIISKQMDFEQSINHLTSCVFKIILQKNGYRNDFYFSNYCEMTLNAPLVLQIQSDEALITVVSNIIDLLSRAQILISPRDLFKRYLPTMDWDTIIKDGERFASELGKEALKNKNSQNEGGMF